MTSVLGDLMALGCAAAWALAVIAFRGLRAVDSTALNLFKNVLAVALLLLTMVALGLSFQSDRPSADWGALVLSGVLGLAVADTLFLSGLRRVDASVAGISECIYSPSVLLLAGWVLGEPMTPSLLGGAALVVLGLVIVAWPPGSSGPSSVDRVDRLGLLLCLSGVMTTAVAVILAKPALEQSHLVEATTVRLLAGAAALFLAELLRGRGRQALGLFTPQPAWRLAVPGAVLGTYVAMILWLGGMKYGTASRAALLNQSGAVFVLLFSRLSGEVVSWRRVAGALVAMTGVLAVLGGRPG